MSPGFHFVTAQIIYETETKSTAKYLETAGVAAALHFRRTKKFVLFTHGYQVGHHDVSTRTSVSAYYTNIIVLGVS